MKGRAKHALCWRVITQTRLLSPAIFTVTSQLETVPSSLKKASHERGRARHMCSHSEGRLSQCSLRVGVYQACGTLRSKAVSYMKSLVTAFHSDLPRGIEPLDVMGGIFPPTCKTRQRINVPGESEHKASLPA